MGFYLLNLGFALLILKIYHYGAPLNTQDLFEILSKKVGGFSIYLGVMLFLNLYMLFRGKRKSKQQMHKEKMLELHKSGLQPRT